MKYSVITFGCRVNQADSLEAEEVLLSRGGVPTQPAEADVILVNTCSVTGASDQGARQIIRKIFRENPRARIVVTGCYATRAPQDVADLPGVIKIIPNSRKPFFAEEIGLGTADRFGDGDGPCGAVIPGTAGRTAYTLRVQTGCDEKCSYCIIPSTRGAGRSRPLEEVLAEIARVHEAGFREIALTGVHLGSYGRDRADGSSLLGLLERIEVNAPSGMRFRISSLEPMDCSTAIVDLVAQSDRLAPHFHLPLQHASDQLLDAMRRPYTRVYYSRLVDRIRSAIPHASIGSDIIVGFPGETETDFAIMESYLSASPLTHLHVFPYSDRPGTAATMFNGKVHGSIVRDRAARVREIGRHLNRRFNRSQDGAVRPALTIEDGSTVITDNYLRVRIPPGLTRNTEVHVRVRAAGDDLVGELAEATA